MGIGYKSLGIYIDGAPGLFIYYDAADNPPLDGDYTLKGGGELIAASVAAQTPEPSTLLLFAAVWARSSPTEGGDSGLLLRFAREPQSVTDFAGKNSPISLTTLTSGDIAQPRLTI